MPSFFDNSTPADEGVHYISQSHDKTLYIITEHDYVHSFITHPKRDTCAHRHSPPRNDRRLQISTQRRAPRPLMTTLMYPQDAQSFGMPPGSPPDLTNSKSSKSSSLHSSTLTDFMGTSDLSHFEDINLDEAAGPSRFHVPLSPSDRVIFEGSRPLPAGGRSLSHSNASFRDLTNTAKPRYPSLKGQVNQAVQRQQSQLNAPGKQLRRGFTSPSAPSLTSLGLAAPNRSSRSQSPSNPKSFPSAPRTLSRRSSRNLDVLPSPGLNSRRQSWQDAKRKTVKEREAECDDEDDELPEDAMITNIPISPRPVQERSPSSCSSLASPNPDVTGPAGQPSPRYSRAPSPSRFSPQPSPNPSIRGISPPGHLARQQTNTWEDTYTNLDADARALTAKLEEFQSDFEKKQEVQRQQPGLTRSASVKQAEPKAKKAALPPVRKSDPLIDPFQPSVEKQKHLSRTRPSWLPPKDRKEEKKHLKEYQKMLARIEEAERLEAQRLNDEALAREQATRIKAEYWSKLLVPNWDSEMTDVARRTTHRKMWWNGIPPRLRGQVWSRAIGNDLEVSEATYNIALDKAQREIKQDGYEALGGRYAQIVKSTQTVWPELGVFGPSPSTEGVDNQPLHQDLVDVCLAYSTYRPDISDQSTGIHHIAALLLLNFPAPQAFITLSNLLNRALPLSFLLHDPNAMHAAFSTTLHALSKKHPSLAQRMETLRVEPRDYLPAMFGSLFCDRLGMEHAARVMDVYAIEGDKIPPCVAVAIMGILEGNCMEGSAEVVARVLREKSVETEIEDFMARVYEAGKTG